MSNQVNKFSPSCSFINHELAMLYLQQQDLSKLSISEFAHKYSEIKDELTKIEQERNNNKVHFV